MLQDINRFHHICYHPRPIMRQSKTFAAIFWALRCQRQVLSAVAPDYVEDDLALNWRANSDHRDCSLSRFPSRPSGPSGKPVGCARVLGVDDIDAAGGHPGRRNGIVACAGFASNPFTRQTRPHLFGAIHDGLPLEIYQQ